VSRWLALLAGLVVGLLALMPARLLLAAPPLFAAGVEGSIWHARLHQAGIGAARLGDVALALNPGTILKGRAQWNMSGAATGSLWRSLAGAGGDGLNATLAGAPLAGLPVANVQLAGVSVALDGRGRCQSASGMVTATLATPLAGQRTLQGAVRCDGAMLAVPMASGDGRVRLDLAAMADGWRARLAVSGAAPAEAAVLAGAGFRTEGGALVRQEEQPW
jgi:hypothetical protein